MNVRSRVIVVLNAEYGLDSCYDGILSTYIQQSKI